MAAFAQSTIAVIEAPLEMIAKGADGAIHLKLAALGGGGDMVEADDFLGQNPLGDWVLAPATTAGQAFSGLPELVPVNGRAQALIGYKRGTGHEKMVLYYPNNEMIVNGADGQVQTY
jgi:hypothetical protein